MDLGEAVQPRKRLVDRRVVFHGAAAQRVEALLERERASSQATEMAKYLGLAGGRQAERGAPAPVRGDEAAEVLLGHPHRRQLRSAVRVVSELVDQALGTAAAGMEDWR